LPIPGRNKKEYAKIKIPVLSRNVILDVLEEALNMNTAKKEVRALLQKLPEDCTIEDVQYHLYVIEKVNRGLQRAKREGTISQQNVEKRLGKWISK
jgi:hypothetical protein